MSNFTDDFDRGSAAAYLEHARWLLEWHNKRSEAATSRAATLLGFLGVILAAILQGAALMDDVHVLVWGLLGLTGLALLGAARYAMLTISAQKVETQDIADLRVGWAERLSGNADGQPAEYDVAETFLNASDLNGPSPVQAASDEADRRVAAFKKSVRLTAAALALLATLAVTVAATAEGGEHEQQHEREQGRQQGQRK